MRVHGQEFVRHSGRPARKQEWTATLNRDRASGGAFVSEDLDRLYHGYLPAQLFAKAEEGVFTYTMPLTKDTNNVRVVLQQLSGEAMDKDRFIFRITAENGRMDWDNGLLPDELVSYYAWYQQSGTAGVDVPDVPGTVTSLSAVVAERPRPSDGARPGRGPPATISPTSGACSSRCSTRRHSV